MMARDLAMALDPALLFRSSGMEPDPWQADLLRGNAPQVLLLCTRQAGKSTAAACIAVHSAVYRPPALVLLLSPSLRQSSELFRKVMALFNALGRGAVPASRESALRLELTNGSRIVSLPGTENTVRGYSGVSLLIVDEAARVPDELYLAVRPMLAVSRGRLICMTTPFGKRGFFFEAWAADDPAWQRVMVTAHDCPRVSREFLERERAAVGDWWFSQEYLCEFRETTDQVFRFDEVMAALSEDVAPLYGGNP
jgi:hypothetical protein